ncbi:alpha-1,6- mannosyltransferase [Spiromyces aspiralis]|uniref:Alpha-1,6- mannosyltransferase n=1 Tax=Spiromyces aspiralis TaxID=68401 RepID=A0ACC1HSG6_9FUNG|nr:alpha-1,6- mannosyltransferase [Spiromyces aspiralis]
MATVRSESYRAMHCRRMVAMLVVASVIFRFEVAVFAIPMISAELLARSIAPLMVARVACIAFVASLAATIAVDSYYWQQVPLWPEWQVFQFNVIQNKSSLWGVSPWHAYFTVFIPKLLLAGTPLALLGVLSLPSLWRFTLPTMIAIAVFSYLPHKEWRFIIHAVPILNLASAHLVNKAVVSTRGSAKILRLVPRLALTLVLLVNLSLTGIGVWRAYYNYPGGVAFEKLHDMYKDSTQPGKCTAATTPVVVVHKDAPPVHPGDYD